MENNHVGILKKIKNKLFLYLTAYLGQDFISETWIRESSLNDVVSKEVLLSSIQVWVSHEPEYLSKTQQKVHVTGHEMLWLLLFKMFIDK